MAGIRRNLADFSLANPIYSGAIVTVYTVDPSTLLPTTTLATLYADLTSTNLLGNPQLLDAEGKWQQPVYIDAPAIMNIGNAEVEDHQTGVTSSEGTFRGDWASGTLYFTGDTVRDGAASLNTSNVYYCASPNISGAFATDLANGVWQIYVSAVAVAAGVIALAVSGALAAVAGAGFLTANQPITVSGDATGSGTTAITLTLAASGVVAGNYSKVTVNGKGIVVSGGAIGLTDVTTALGTTALPVANGGTGVKTSTGTGSTVLSTSPALVTPDLGTPSALTLTNATGLPLATGVTGMLPAVNLPAATAGARGGVKPDGTTITIVGDVISASAGAKVIDQQVFNSSGTWTKPTGFSAKAMALIQLWGAGGSGMFTAGATQSGGGGGGSYKEWWVPVSSFGATEAITVGAGGAAVSTPTSGNNGGSSSFGAWITAYGGTGGGGPQSVGNGGGAGGGWYSTAAAGTPANDDPTNASIIAGTSGYPGYGSGAFISGGSNYQAAGYGGPWLGGGGGAGALTFNNGGKAHYGGGGGGGCDNTTAGTGGFSLYGGAGGAGSKTANGVTGISPGGGGGACTHTGSSSGGGAAGRVVITTFD